MSRPSRSLPQSLQILVSCLVIVIFAAGCSAGPQVNDPVPTSPPPPLAVHTPSTLTQDQVDTLESLRKIDDHPLFTMTYAGSYPDVVHTGGKIPLNRDVSGWACSLFAAFGDPVSKLYGRNFDWAYSPAVLLFTDPPGGYASVSMVDIAYLDLPQDRIPLLDESPLEDRLGLLDAPFIPFDGMNEHGLVVGMAAVPPGGMQFDPDKAVVGSLGGIRLVLDNAADIDQAISIFESYNIDFAGGPPVHYLLAEPSGRAVLVEFYNGQMALTENRTPWFHATNFLLSSVGDVPGGRCWRYDRIDEQMSQAAGILDPSQAMSLLSQVSQENTQWSIVYDMLAGDIHVVMDREYHHSHMLPFSTIEKGE